MAFGIADHLNPPVGEILGETRQRQARPIDRRFVNDFFKPAAPAISLSSKELAFSGVEPFDRYDIALHRALKGQMG